MALPDINRVNIEHAFTISYLVWLTNNIEKTITLNHKTIIVEYELMNY